MILKREIENDFFFENFMAGILTNFDDFIMSHRQAFWQKRMQSKTVFFLNKQFSVSRVKDVYNLNGPETSTKNNCRDFKRTIRWV